MTENTCEKTFSKLLILKQNKQQILYIPIPFDEEKTYSYTLMKHISESFGDKHNFYVALSLSLLS